MQAWLIVFATFASVRAGEIEGHFDEISEMRAGEQGHISWTFDDFSDYQLDLQLSLVMYCDTSTRHVLGPSEKSDFSFMTDFDVPDNIDNNAQYCFRLRDNEADKELWSDIFTIEAARPPESLSSVKTTSSTSTTSSLTSSHTVTYRTTTSASGSTSSASASAIISHTLLPSQSPADTSSLHFDDKITDSASSTLSAGEIIGVALGGVAVIMGLVSVLIWACVRGKRRQHGREDANSEKRDSREEYGGDQAKEQNGVDGFCDGIHPMLREAARMPDTVAGAASSRFYPAGNLCGTSERTSLPELSQSAMRDPVMPNDYNTQHTPETEQTVQPSGQQFGLRSLSADHLPIELACPVNDTPILEMDVLGSQRHEIGTHESRTIIPSRMNPLPSTIAPGFTPAQSYQENSILWWKDLLPPSLRAGHPQPQNNSETSGPWMSQIPPAMLGSEYRPPQPSTSTSDQWRRAEVP